MIWGAVGPPWWDDRVTILVGGGPSLSGFELRTLPVGARILGVNQSIFDCPCEAGISIDFAFVARNRDRLAAFAEGRELYLAVSERRPERMPQIPGAIYLRTGADLVDGGTSGFAALQIAALKRARHIVLLGFDYGAIGGRHHYHDAYAGTSVPAEDAIWRSWAERFDQLLPMLYRRGIDVINASPDSRINCFPKCSIGHALMAHGGGSSDGRRHGQERFVQNSGEDIVG